MKHNIRQYVINEYGLPVAKIETVHGELESGTHDAYGRRVFEGDRVLLYADNSIYPVVFDGDSFLLADSIGAPVAFLEDLESKELEVVGHVDD